MAIRSKKECVSVIERNYEQVKSTGFSNLINAWKQEASRYSERAATITIQEQFVLRTLEMLFTEDNTQLDTVIQNIWQSERFRMKVLCSDGITRNSFEWNSDVRLTVKYDYLIKLENVAREFYVKHRKDSPRYRGVSDVEREANKPYTDSEVRDNTSSGNTGFPLNGQTDGKMIIASGENTGEATVIVRTLEDASRIKIAAEEEAKRIRQNAEAEAERITKAAEVEATRIKNSAENEAEWIKREANASADSTRKNAELDAERILDTAKLSGEDMVKGVINQRILGYQKTEKAELAQLMEEHSEACKVTSGKFLDIEKSMEHTSNAVQAEWMKALGDQIEQLEHLREGYFTYLRDWRRSLYTVKYDQLARTYCNLYRMVNNTVYKMIRDELSGTILEGGDRDLSENTIGALKKLDGNLRVVLADFEKGLSQIGLYAFYPNVGDAYDEGMHIPAEDYEDPYAMTIGKTICPAIMKKTEYEQGDDEVILPAEVILVESE